MQRFDWQIPQRLTQIVRSAVKRLGQGVHADLYMLSTPALTAASGAFGTSAVVAVPRDFDFLWIASTARQDAGGATSSGFMVQLLHVERGYYFTNGETRAAGTVHRDNYITATHIFGSGQRPFPWAYPYMLRASDRIQIRTYNSGAKTPTFRGTFIGLAIRPRVPVQERAA